ncbi:MAG: TonB-dependent receptor, partial [Acidobacteria bacterium]|nr:TonB-dependent receptor [Acidobacteriota bacterium]
NLGGPVYIPKLYDGRDKTFFFYSFEQNRLTVKNSATYTLPSNALQRGDFRELLGNVMSDVCYDPSDPSTCGKDPLGNPLIEGTIYDPSTTTTVQRPVNGVQTDFVVRTPFMGCDGLTLNQICMNTADLDPVAMNYQALYPTLTTDTLTNNYSVTWPRESLQTINAFKIDHNISNKFKISGFYSYNSQDFDTFTDGLEVPLSSGRTMTEKSHTVRLTADYTISSTMFLHLGAGLMHFLFKDPQPNVNYDAYTELGLPGTYSTVAPSIKTSPNTDRGGLRDTGPVAYGNTWQIKPTGTASLAWVKGNHSMKFGGELRVESHPSTVITPSNGTFIFDPLQTSLPYLGTAGNIGHPYASFLLGTYNKGEIGLPNRFHLGKHAFAFYAQDSWKITPKITLDYGLRWDYQTYLQETEGRMPTFSPTALNPNYGNIPGDAIFEKDIADVYPHAWGPRLGLAYQFMPKTVLRAGFGISYGQTGALEMWNLRMGSFVRFGPNSYNYDAIGLLRDGPNVGGTPVVPVWPNSDPGQAPAAPQADYMPWIHEKAGRPPRQAQWSIGIQHEVLPNLLLDVSYVGNRGIWWNSNGAINDPNRVTPSILEDHNFDLNNYDDRALMLKQWNQITPEEAAAHNLTLPYSGFTGTVNQALRPFPHVGNIFQIWAPIGKTWYDSLQVKVTKRYSHGLDFSLAYSWQKELTIGAETNDTAFVTPAAVNNINDFNSNKTISGLSVPHRVVIAVSYQVPKWDVNKFASWVLRDWTIGALLTYASGLPIMAPRGDWNQTPNHDIGNLLKLCSGMGVFGGCNGSLLFSDSPASYASRVKGEDPFLVDPNSSFDPRKNFMLNLDAWTNPPDGQYGTGSPYYSDYRYRRRPSENMSLGRNFPIREGMNVSLRVELMNIFNRVQIPNPGVDYNSNSINWGQISAPDGTAIFGFGQPGSAVAPIADTAGQRTGQIVMRFTF